MTEQEKHGKAVDEIFEVITEWANKALVRSYAGASVLNIHNAMELSKKIAPLFVRKEEEVQKETAKKILFRVKLFLDEQTKTVKHLSRIKSSAAIPQSCVECYEGSQDNRLDELSRIAKDFGVEVEE